MDKIKTHLVDYIQNVIETASLLNVESVVIDDHSVRGMNEDGMFILQRDNLPDDLPFDGIGFGSIAALKSRMTLFEDYEAQYELKKQQNGYSWPYLLKFKSNTSKTSVEYRCAAPLTVKAPKNTKDPVAFSFYMDEDSVNMLVKSNVVMRTETVLLSSKKNKVTFKLCDENSNVLEHRITKDLNIIDEDDFGDSFMFEYKARNILPILKYLAKQYEEFEINITTRGLLQVNVNDLMIYILCEKD